MHNVDEGEGASDGLARWTPLFKSSRCYPPSRGRPLLQFTIRTKVAWSSRTGGCTMVPRDTLPAKWIFPSEFIHSSTSTNTVAFIYKRNDRRGRINATILWDYYIPVLYCDFLSVSFASLVLADKWILMNWTDVGDGIDRSNVLLGWRMKINES